MKRALLVLTILGLAISPLMVSSAGAATLHKRVVVKHHRKIIKKHAAKRALHKHNGKAA
jgi:hypothetical protein